MSEFIIDGKKLMAVDDVDGEVWLRGKDILDILKSTKRDSEELQGWISDQVVHFTKNPNENSPLYKSDLVLKLKEEINRKNGEIADNHKTISKLQGSLAALQKQLSQIEPEFLSVKTVDKESVNLFFLIKKNLEKIESNMDYFPYYVLRAKKRYEKECLDHLKSKFPFSEVILRTEDPPKVDLFNSITELKNVKSCENHLETDLTEEELISLFEELKFSKRYLGSAETV